MFKILFLILKFAIVKSTILRLPECGQYDAEFSVVSVDKKVETGLFLQIQNASTLDCVEKCTFHGTCYSVNYHRQQRLCELLNVDDIFQYYRATAFGWVYQQTPFKTKV